MALTTHHHVLASRKVRLYAVIFEIVIFVGGGSIFSYISWILGNDDVRAVFVGTFVIAIAILQIILMVNRSQTIGKYFFEIQVVSNKTGKRVGFWHYALLRTFIGETLVIGALPLIGLVFQPIYFIIDNLFIFRKDKRTLHDLIAGTCVIRLPEEKKAKKVFDFSKL